MPPDGVAARAGLIQMMLEGERRRLWNAMLRVNIEKVIRLFRIADVVYRLFDSNPDRDDFSNRHISSIISFKRFMSSPYTMPVALAARAIWLMFTSIL